MILTFLLTLARTSISLVKTDRGRRIEIARRVGAPSHLVWELYTHVEHWAAWGPPVTAVQYPDREIAAETDGLVQVFGLRWVPFRIETVDDRLWTWSVWGRTPPADGHRVDDPSPEDSRDDPSPEDGHDDPSADGCWVALELPLWAPWYLPVCWLALSNLQRVAEAGIGR